MDLLTQGCNAEEEVAAEPPKKKRRESGLLRAVKKELQEEAAAARAANETQQKGLKPQVQHSFHPQGCESWNGADGCKARVVSSVTLTHAQKCGQEW